MTDDDHTNEAPDAAPDSTGGPHGPQRLDDASPQGDDAGPAPAAESPPRPSALRPTACANGAQPGCEKSPAPKRAPRSPKRPAAKSGASRGGRPSRAKVPPHLTPAERAAQGKAARAEVPRSVHGEWASPSNRRDPVDLLEEQAATRVQELVPIRYGRMLVSPFTFFRGAAS